VHVKPAQSGNQCIHRILAGLKCLRRRFTQRAPSAESTVPVFISAWQASRPTPACSGQDLSDLSVCRGPGGAVWYRPGIVQGPASSPLDLAQPDQTSAYMVAGRGRVTVLVRDQPPRSQRQPWKASCNIGQVKSREGGMEWERETDELEKRRRVGCFLRYECIHYCSRAGSESG
jgi:hypothetical protein